MNTPGEYSTSPVLKWLSSAISSNCESSLESFVRSHSAVDMSRLMQNIIDDLDALNWISRHSYHHSNGFDKLVLAHSLDKQSTLRLHVWWPNSSGITRGDKNIHNHRWNFISRVISGTVIHEIFARDELGQLYQHYRYKPIEFGTSYNLSCLGTAYLRPLTREMFLVGHVYSISAEMLHRVSIEGDAMAVTLVLTGSIVCDETDVFSNRYRGMPEVFANTRLTTLEIRV